MVSTEKTSRRVSMKMILIIIAVMFFLSAIASLMLLFNYFDTITAYRNNLYHITLESYKEQFTKNYNDLALSMRVTALDQALRSNIFRKDVTDMEMLSLSKDMSLVVQSNSSLLAPKAQIYQHSFFTYLPGDGRYFAPISRMEEEPWYDDYMASGRLEYTCFPYSTLTRSFLLSTVHAINDFSTGQSSLMTQGETCYQTTTVDIGSLMPKPSDIISDVGAYAFLFENISGNLLYQSSNNLMPLAKTFYQAKKSPTPYDTSLTQGDVTYTLVMATMSNLDVSLVLLYEPISLAHASAKNELLIVTFTLVLFVVLSSTLLVFYLNYSKRIRGVVQGLDRFDETSPAAPTRFAGGDEIDRIEHHAILMQNHIRHLIQEEYTVKLQMLSAQQEALIACINPHFLYNTLSTISAMASLEGAPDTGRMIEALSDMFKYSADVNHKIVTIKDELKNISDYLYIQGIRYSNSFVYHTSVPVEFLACSIPKLILQPVVENCFKHGFLGKGSAALKNEIMICAVQEGSYLKLYIYDNGQGMRKERLLELQKNLAQSGVPAQGLAGKEIGLGNVHRRLRLIYGDPCGVAVSCEETGYTCVKIIIPFSL